MILTKYFANDDIATTLEELDAARRSFGRFIINSNGARPFPAMNVYAGEKNFLVVAEIPGVNPVKLDITAEDNVLTIKGVRDADESPEGTEWFRKERESGEFSRSIRLPFNVDQSRVTARVSKGILRLEVAKPADEKPVRIEVKTE
jgi:HSP20 family protein